MIAFNPLLSSLAILTSGVFSPASCCNKSMWVIVSLSALAVIFEEKKFMEAFDLVVSSVFTHRSLLDIVSCIHESIKVLVYKMLHVLDNFDISL